MKHISLINGYMPKWSSCNLAGFPGKVGARYTKIHTVLLGGQIMNAYQAINRPTICIEIDLNIPLATRYSVVCVSFSQALQRLI